MIVTVGHGTSSQQELVDLLAGAGIGSVVDVRRHPGSRRHPHVARDQLSTWLPAAGVDYYRWERLGGRRSRVEWRCQRRLIADHVTLLTDVPLRHLLPDGRLDEHRPTDAVCVEDGRLLYDGGEPGLL